MHAVARKQDQNDEIRNQQCQIKAVDVVEAPERGVEEVLANVGRDPPRPSGSGDRCCEISNQEMLERPPVLSSCRAETYHFTQFRR